MSLFDDVIKALAQRNELNFSGAVSIRLVEGGVRMGGEVSTEIHDTQKNKTVATMVISLSAKANAGELVIPVRLPQ